MVIGGAAALSPCFCSAPYTFLNASTNVSKAESQLADPLANTMIFAVSVTSSPNASPGFGCGAAGAAAGGGGGGGGGCANDGAANRSAPKSPARPGNRIEASKNKVARPARLDSYHARWRLACTDMHRPMHGRWRCAKLSPYKLRFRIIEMSALSGHAFVKMNGLGNEIVVV